MFMNASGITDRATLLVDNCNKTMTGTRCTQLIILDDWEIKDDYPW